MVNTTAMDQMTRYYWGMLGARAAAAGATRTTSLRAWPPPARGSGGGEPSWEELAFARDAAGHLGGCVWPPRSYTCTFCRREFRSAQALGGHMNVHRRDRARLRQCASPDHDVIQEAPQQQQPTTFPSYISTIIKESKNKVVISIPAATPGRKEALESDEEEMIMANRRKRRRVDQQPEAVLPFFLRLPASCQSVEKNAKVPKVITSPSSSSSLQLAGRQEVDLELRLGSNPKVP